MKKITLLAISLSLCICLQAAIGGWKTYLAFHSISDIEPGDGIVYVLSCNDLYSYSNDEVFDYNKVNSLSDTYIRKIAYCKSQKALIIVYENSNIDILYNDGTVVNVSDIKRNKGNDDKTINNIDIYGKYAYLSTNFGIIKLNVQDASISDTYRLGENVSTVALYKNKLYAANYYKTFFVGDTKKNLLDKTNWERIGGPAPSQFIAFDDKLYGVISTEIYQILENTCGIGPRLSTDISYTSYSDGCIICGHGANKAEIFTNATKSEVVTSSSNLNYLVYDKTNNCYWQDINIGYLTSAVVEDGKLLTGSNKIKPEGPRYNNFGFMRFFNGNLYTSGGGYSFANDLLRPATVQVLKGDEIWQIYDDSLNLKTGYRFDDANVLDIDPTNPDRVISGGRTGMYEYLNGKFVRVYNIGNSPLQAASAVSSTSKNYVMVFGMKFDIAGNLWCYNSFAPSVNLLRLNNDSTWTNLYDSSLMYDKTHAMYYIGSMMFDSRGLLWFASDHWDTPKLYCYNTDTKEVKIYDNFVNQDNTTVEVNSIHSVAEDKQGNIWIGTIGGPLMLETSQFSSSKPIFTQVKVPRNDGTSTADYLLSGVNITGIVVDGADRKWFISGGNGAYLMDADNITEIHHFTTENSKLLSDNIESIAIDGTTGRVYFGTDKGLCSYMSDAIDPSDDSVDNMYAYPNPVKSDYTGKITIVGLTTNANVKIVSSSGTLIAEGKSNGGLFTWDGCDSNGRRVASGIYTVLSSNQDGKKSSVCKIAMIK